MGCSAPSFAHEGTEMVTLISSVVWSSIIAFVIVMLTIASNTRGK